MVYTAEPGSPSAERLQLLASWAADTPSPTTTTDSSIPNSQKETHADHP